MSVEVLYRLRKDEPGATLVELDDVVLLADVTTMDGDMIATGTQGTVVGVWTHGKNCIVEFSEPEGAVATVASSDLMRVTPVA